MDCNKCDKKYLCETYYDDGLSFNNTETKYACFKPREKGFHTTMYKNEFTDNGPKFKLTFELEVPYELYKVFEYPANCLTCPVGFMNNKNCGRNVPFTNEDYNRRPSTCKLKKISPEEIQQMIIQSYNMIESVPHIE